MGGGGSKIGGFNPLLWIALGGAGGTVLAWELRGAGERKLRTKLDNRERLIAAESLTILNAALAQADEALKACAERHDRLLESVTGRYLHCAELDQALANAQNAEAQAAEYCSHMRVLQKRIFNYIVPLSGIEPATPIDSPAAPSATTTVGISRCVGPASVSATRTLLPLAPAGKCRARRSLRLVPHTFGALFRDFLKFLFA